MKKIVKFQNDIYLHSNYDRIEVEQVNIICFDCDKIVEQVNKQCTDTFFSL